MSAEQTVREAALAALRGDAALMDMVNGLFDGPPVQASAPYVVVGECAGVDWGAKDVEGRELRLSISLHDKGASPARLGDMLARVDAILRNLSGEAGAWRIVTIRFVRSRIAPVGQAQKTGGGWTGLADYRARVVPAGL